MDFLNRSEQADSPRPSAPAASTSSSAAVRGDKGPRKKETSKGMRLAAVGLLFAVTVLVVAVLGVLFVGPNGDQSKFVNSGKWQAVFLTNGQVYFGKLNEVSKDYFRLDNIYYLTQNTSTDSKGNTTTDGNYTLVKLGCQQIHDPYDEMVIERSQVSFWENLQDGGKVATSIKQFQQQNPKGPDCSQVSNQTQASSSSSSNQGGSSSTTGTSSGTNSSTNSSTKNP